VIVAAMPGATAALPAPLARRRLVVIAKRAGACSARCCGRASGSRRRSALDAGLVERLAAAAVAFTADDVAPRVEQDEIERAGRAQVQEEHAAAGDVEAVEVDLVDAAAVEAVAHARVVGDEDAGRGVVGGRARELQVVALVAARGRVGVDDDRVAPAQSGARREQQIALAAHPRR
jgi:hypothetical protein